MHESSSECQTRRKVRQALSAFVSLLAVATAHAQTPAVTLGGFGSGFTISGTFGWYFQVNNPITITHVGLWDNGGDGMVRDHDLAIWRVDTQAVVVSAIVPAGGAPPLINGFRYQDIQDYTLEVGRYVIGAQYDGPPFDICLADVDIVSTNTRDLTLLAGASAFGPGPLVFPEMDGPPNQYFGPNFLIVPAPGAASILAMGWIWPGRRRLRA